MTQTSCIRQPENNRFIQLHEWQIEFCDENRCAALLLSHFTNWHNWKLQNDSYYQRYNDIAEKHGDGRPHNQNAYLFFSTQELVDGCMGLFGKQVIRNGLELLIDKGVISVHKNPNPRYHFDRTKYFQFYPDVCNEWITKRYFTNTSSQLVDSIDRPEVDDRGAANSLPSATNSRPSVENGRTITDTTNNTTNKNKLTNTDDDCFESDSKSINPILKEIVITLEEMGMSTRKLQTKSDFDLIQFWVDRGAQAEHFGIAYDRAIKATSESGNQFGIRYLAKIVENLLAEPAKVAKKDNELVYESDFKNAESWAGDLI